MRDVAKRSLGKRIVDTATLLVGLLILQYPMAVLPMVPRLDPKTSPPISVLFGEIAHTRTNYTFKVEGSPAPSYKGVYTQEGLYSWRNSTSSNQHYFNCRVVSGTGNFREFELVINNPPEKFKGHQISFLFENEAGFLLLRFEMRANDALIPPNLVPYIAGGASFAGGLIILICLILYFRNCRRRCHKARRRRHRPYEQSRMERDSDEVNIAQYTAPRCERSHPGHPSGTQTIRNLDHHHLMTLSLSRNLAPPTPDPPCPCNGMGSSQGYIDMQGEEGPSGRRGELTEVIQSELNRIRARQGGRPWGTMGCRSNMANRRMSRSVPSLFVHEDNPTPRRKPPQHPMMQSPHTFATIGYGRAPRNRPSLGHLRQRSHTVDTDDYREEETLPDFLSMSHIRGPLAEREDEVLLRRRPVSEEFDSDHSDGSQEAMVQRESENKYVTMTRYVHTMWQEGEGDGCGKAQARRSGPVYMNTLELCEECSAGDQGWAGGYEA